MSRDEMDKAESLVAAVRDEVGDKIQLMIEVHGRLSVGGAIEMGRRLEKHCPAWYEEPVWPNSLELLTEDKRRCRSRSRRESGCTRWKTSIASLRCERQTSYRWILPIAAGCS